MLSIIMSLPRDVTAYTCTAAAVAAVWSLDTHPTAVMYDQRQ